MANKATTPPILQDSSKQFTSLLPPDWIPPSSKTPEGQRRLALVIADMISRGKNSGEHHFARVMQTMYAASLEAPPIAEILDEMVSIMLSRDQMDEIFTAGRGGMSVGRDLARFLFPGTETATETEDEAEVSVLDLWSMVGVLETKLDSLVRGYEQPGGFTHDTSVGNSKSRKKKNNRKKKKNRGKEPQDGEQQEQAPDGGSSMNNEGQGQQKPQPDVEPSLAKGQFQSLDAVIERREALIAGMKAILEDYRKPLEDSGLDEVD